MKFDFIINVFYDLKILFIFIINYVDLIKKEELI